jgi:hypothetical protein
MREEREVDANRAAPVLPAHRPSLRQRATGGWTTPMIAPSFRSGRAGPAAVPPASVGCDYFAAGWTLKASASLSVT